jgi:hypothetical protein
VSIARSALAALLVLAAFPARATDFGSAAVGTTGSEFLLMDTSARGIAMGGAMAAATDDSSSIYWNPAGLAQVPRMSASFMHAQYIADIIYETASYAQRISDSAVVGGGVRYLNGGSVTGTDINGLNTGTFTPASYVAEAGWGQSIYDLSDSEMDLAMGVTGRMISSTLGAATATGYGADFGVQSRFYTNSSSYDVGLTIQNLGSGQRFDQVRNTLPARIRFGGAVKPTKSLTLTAEMVAPVNDTPFGAAGAELTWEVQRNMKAAARAGVNTETYQSLGFASILSLGLGLTINDFTFDYAFVPMGVLGTATQRLSISFNLPAKVSRRYRER